MGPPVRTVCTACLQSLEVASGDEFAGHATCPYCGSEVHLTMVVHEGTTGDEFASPPTDPESVTPRDQASGKLPPVRIARFVIREPLGEGGYGQVYRAYDPHLDREVALKVLKPNRLGEKALERFYREARAAARLDHPNIVGLHDAGCDEGRCWIAYQLVPGRTLSMIRDLDRPTVEASIRVVRDLALALEHAHGRGVFHRDLKPANILVDDSGRARLTDFGLARRGDVDSDLTREGTVLGTPQYMSPEAAAGRAHQADARSDVYSLGVILYELLCGRRPVDVPSGAPLWRSGRIVATPTPRSVDRTIPPALDRICMKALAFEPEGRYPTARALAEALTHQIPAARGPSRPGRRAVTRPLAIGLAVVASLIVIAMAMVAHSRNRAGTRASLPTALISGLDREAVRPSPIPPAARPPAAEVKPVEADLTRVAPRPTPPEDRGPPDLLDEPAVRSRGSKDLIFHRKGACGHLKGKDESRLVDLGTVRGALAQGFRPCRDCLANLPRDGEGPPKAP